MNHLGPVRKQMKPLDLFWPLQLPQESWLDWTRYWPVSKYSSSTLKFWNIHTHTYTFSHTSILSFCHSFVKLYVSKCLRGWKIIEMWGWVSGPLGSNDNMLVNLLFLEEMVCNVCQFLWYKYTHHGWFQAFNMTLLKKGVERNEHKWVSWAGTSQQ